MNGKQRLERAIENVNNAVAELERTREVVEATTSTLEEQENPVSEDRIDHAAKARKLLDAAHEAISLKTARLNQREAQVHATLALVEQQRIANIIAIANNVSEDPDVPVTAGERAAWLALCNERPPHSLRPEIREALGIRE